MQRGICKILVSVFGCLGATTVFADIKDDIYEESRRVQDEVLQSTARIEDLERAYDYLRRANELIAGSGGGGSGNAAIATFLCDSSAYLRIELISPSGTQKEQVYIGDNTRCGALAQVLSELHNRVQGLELIGVCDSSNYLKKYALTASGLITKVSNQYIGNADTCRTHEERINHGSGVRHGAIATYICDSSAYNIELVNTQGVADSEKSYIGNADSCGQQAEKLFNLHARVTEFDLIAVCDSSAYLVRYSLNPNGVLTKTDSTYIGDMERCHQQAAGINGR